MHKINVSLFDQVTFKIKQKAEPRLSSTRSSKLNIKSIKILLLHRGTSEAGGSRFYFGAKTKPSYIRRQLNPPGFSLKECFDSGWQ